MYLNVLLKLTHTKNAKNFCKLLVFNFHVCIHKSNKLTIGN